MIKLTCRSPVVNSPYYKPANVLSFNNNDNIKGKTNTKNKQKNDMNETSTNKNKGIKDTFCDDPIVPFCFSLI